MLRGFLTGDIFTLMDEEDDCRFELLRAMCFARQKVRRTLQNIRCISQSSRVIYHGIRCISATARILIMNQCSTIL